MGNRRGTASSYKVRYRHCTGWPGCGAAKKLPSVASDAYYAAAVIWAEKNDITGGIGGGLFGSNNNCTRAQIVIFIYRSVK